MVDEPDTPPPQGVDALADPEVTLVHSRPQLQESKETRLDLLAEQNWETLEKITYVAPEKRPRVKGRIKKPSRRKKSKRRKSRHHQEQQQPASQDGLFHGLLLGSFIGAALAEFVLAKFK
ncbi:AFL072C-Ap [Eremothecium gossypii ATCC 10895]|uniref:AFL072C-Ap n=1 Tax=Eremothecium gossypii (strain ATCC 10895 / CBS 109.51 / FGSC 9923 / NRRL Y-1056) TaxID=284811 RepID=D8FGF6_EREGS|nr:AFL072C-Ap [Eremothecium gossypii ATCC 10895]ADJ41786.1 AFL072C-Ap [Eremothecium gossypii ATCC 10895]AEY97610.1 FAFL072C-Ap [Eremothecium gossypii FDAG1]